MIKKVRRLFGGEGTRLTAPAYGLSDHWQGSRRVVAADIPKRSQAPSSVTLEHRVENVAILIETLHVPGPHRQAIYAQRGSRERLVSELVDARIRQSGATPSSTAEVEAMPVVVSINGHQIEVEGWASGEIWAGRTGCESILVKLLVSGYQPHRLEIVRLESLDAYDKELGYRA